MNILIGLTTDDWWRLLKENRFAIDPPYWGRAALVTIFSFVNSMHRRREEKLYGAAVADVEIKAPLFILGHWRSGTTLLHSLLALDERFAYPNLFQVSNPHTFLYRESRMRERSADTSPQKRPMDDMGVTAEDPGEDESAVLVIGLRSPLLGWLFPRREAHYDRYLTFRGVSEEDVERWKTAFMWFLKKLTWKYDRPLVLKSPTHTCRIQMLLDLFPDARFVHIHRNPYTVFRSTRRLYEEMIPRVCFQRPNMEHLEERILQRYRTMYDVFFEERSLIPDGHFHEVCFEELEEDILGQVAGIYEALSIPGFQELEPHLKRYVESIAGYQKNVYTPLAEPLRRQVARAWQRSFEEWGYAV